mmetsp:Transcript_32143/g.109211  ORF Transcript_32143/g.109211 Transcript_32143/m.109211 type:complete len:209 (-) Transcript_32143:2388-3014(-)
MRSVEGSGARSRICDGARGLALAVARPDHVEHVHEVALHELRVQVLLEHGVLLAVEERLVGEHEQLLEPLGPPRFRQDAPPGLARLDARRDDVRREHGLELGPGRGARRDALLPRRRVRVRVVPPQAALELEGRRRRLGRDGAALPELELPRAHGAARVLLHRLGRVAHLRANRPVSRCHTSTYTPIWPIFGRIDGSRRGLVEVGVKM